MMNKIIILLCAVVTVRSYAMDTKEVYSPLNNRRAFYQRPSDSPNAFIRKIITLNQKKIALSRIRDHEFEFSCDGTKEISRETSIDKRTVFWIVNEVESKKRLWVFFLEHNPKVFAISSCGNKMAYIKTIFPIGPDSDRKKAYHTLVLRNIGTRKENSSQIEDDLIPHSLFFDESNSSIIIRGERLVSSICKPKKNFQKVLIVQQYKVLPSIDSVISS